MLGRYIARLGEHGRYAARGRRGLIFLEFEHENRQRMEASRGDYHQMIMAEVGGPLCRCEFIKAPGLPMCMIVVNGIFIGVCLELSLYRYRLKRARVGALLQSHHCCCVVDSDFTGQAAGELGSLGPCFGCGEPLCRVHSDHLGLEWGLPRVALPKAKSGL